MNDSNLISILAWSLFRVEEPENLGSPDPQIWSRLYVPKAEEMLLELSVRGYQVIPEAVAC